MLMNGKAQLLAYYRAKWPQVKKLTPEEFNGMTEPLSQALLEEWDRIGADFVGDEALIWDLSFVVDAAKALDTADLGGISLEKLVNMHLKLAGALSFDEHPIPWSWLMQEFAQRDHETLVVFLALLPTLKCEFDLIEEVNGNYGLIQQPTAK